MQVGVLKVKKKAFFIEQPNGLFEPLDLKTKRLNFTTVDFSKCGQVLQRKIRSLSYSCKIRIPHNSSLTKLRTQVSAKTLKVKFGRTEKSVRIKISPDARYVTFFTEFDDTGVDFELSRFNDEFFGVYAKAAHQVIQEAMDQAPLVIKVLEKKG